MTVNLVNGPVCSSFRASRGQKFQGENDLQFQENRTCAGTPTSALLKRSFLSTSLQLFRLVWWLVVFQRCVGGGDVKRYDVMWLAAR